MIGCDFSSRTLSGRQAGATSLQMSRRVNQRTFKTNKFTFAANHAADECACRLSQQQRRFLKNHGVICLCSCHFLNAAVWRVGSSDAFGALCFGNRGRRRGRKRGNAVHQEATPSCCRETTITRTAWNSCTYKSLY